MIVLWYDRKQEQILLEAKEQVGQPQFFLWNSWAGSQVVFPRLTVGSHSLN